MSENEPTRAPGPEPDGAGPAGLPQVVITDFITGEAAVEREVLGGVAEVVCAGAESEAELLQGGAVAPAEALMVYHFLGISAAGVARLDRCRLIVRCGVGFDNVDAAAAAARGIAVSNVPDYGTEEVADSALGSALALARGTAFLNSRMRAGRGRWDPAEAAPLHRLRGRVFGVVGLGRIGTAVVPRARALGMEVVFHDPYKPEGYDKALGIRRVERLDDLLAEAHILSLHCPATPETEGLIGVAELARMRPGGYLVNTARGSVVDTAAVAEALATGHLAGAAIDVLAEEPPAGDDPLVAAWRDPAHPAHDRLLLTPHAAFYSEEGMVDIRVKAAQECRRLLLGEPLRNVVNGVRPGAGPGGG